MTDSDRRLLFVCTANVCRSPMAAALADRVALELGLEPEIRSAGVSAVPGLPAAPGVVAVCREIGIDLERHRSRLLDAEVVRWADRVFVMEDVHAVAVRALVPEIGEAAVVPLGPLVGKAFVSDPMGSWFRSSYRATRDELATAIRRVFARRVS